MATDNKPVTCYLPDDLGQYLTQYCTEYDITRKDKEGNIRPALGTAVVEILKRFFIGETSPTGFGSVPSTVLNKDEIKAIVDEILQESCNSPSPSPLPDGEEKLDTAIASIRQEFQPALELVKK